MAITPPNGIAPSPTPLPVRGDRTTFSARVDAFMPWFTGAGLQQIYDWALNVYNNASYIYSQMWVVSSLVDSAMGAGLQNASNNAILATTAKTAAETARDEAVSAWTAAVATNPNLDAAVRLNPSTISADFVVPSFYNAVSTGPLLTIGRGVHVTVNKNGSWTII